ncbi:MAG: hypothetical protein QW666_00395 [Candidatus Woesearchaeota archaeon]
MKTKILIGLLALILLAGVVSALEYVSPYPYGGSSIYTDVGRSGPQRISNYDTRVQEYKVSTTVELKPPVEKGYDYFAKYLPFYPRGSARLDSRRNRYYPRSHVVLSTKDIEPSYKKNNVYEAWLYDADTGYRLSLGIFKAAMGGVGLLEYRGNNYLDPYDFVVVTAEPYPDPDPLPGEVVLIGPIMKQREYYRPFTYQQQLYGYED